MRLNDKNICQKNKYYFGIGCGSVGRAVASNTRDVFTINCIERTIVKKKEAGNGPIFKNKH